MSTSAGHSTNTLRYSELQICVGVRKIVDQCACGTTSAAGRHDEAAQLEGADDARSDD